MRDAFDWLPAYAVVTVQAGSRGFDTLVGSDGHDALIGRGGGDMLIGDVAGTVARDILIGGGGADFFNFQFVPAHGRDADVIMDFKPGTDALVLRFDFLPAADKPVTTYGPDLLDPSSFVMGGRAKDADDFVIYRKKTGAIFIDTDGTGPEAQQKVAILANKAKIDASDIYL
jgi:Ca2+-binding RTX toxin-like protein